MTPPAELEDGLLAILACPIDKGPLLYLSDQAMLYNPRLQRAYRVEDGVPIMLASGGTPVTDDQHEKILERVRRGEAAATCGRSPTQLASS
jgi:uncharacterized protein YbaR (Trm112 family)